MNRNPVTNHTPRPEMYDVNGSADFFNKADYGLVVERDKEVGVTRVYVEKVKFKHLGAGGVATLSTIPSADVTSPAKSPKTRPSHRNNGSEILSMTARAGCRRRSCLNR